VQFLAKVSGDFGDFDFNDCFRRRCLFFFFWFLLDLLDLVKK